MTRIMEILVAVSALAGIATFLGIRTAVRRTLRTLGRKPHEPASLSTPMSRRDRRRAQAFLEENNERRNP